VSGRTVRRGRGARRLLIDLTPVRRSRDLRCLVLGQLISVFGTQLTTVAVPYQVYQLTRSSLDVGLVSLAQLFPLIAGSLLGGSVVDATGVGGPAPLPTSAKPSSKPTSAVT
jgi:MFS family permease